MGKNQGIGATEMKRVFITMTDGSSRRILGLLLVFLVLPHRSRAFVGRWSISSSGFVLPASTSQLQLSPKPSSQPPSQRLYYRSDAENLQDEVRVHRKDELLSLLEEVPSNAPTPGRLTRAILDKVQQLEEVCATPDEDVLVNLGGNWELLWTAQDRRSKEWRQDPVRAWINPLENQSYSNNPDGEGGRANPLLPRRVQDRLERMGILKPSTTSTRSSQSVDLKAGQVKNVVTIELPLIGLRARVPRLRFPRRRRARRDQASLSDQAKEDDALVSGRSAKDEDSSGARKKRSRLASITVTVGFRPNKDDSRRVDVKFDSARLKLPGAPMINFPLGPVGPRGWLRTGYIDSDLRITRGHKGSVFILQRPQRRRQEV